jgi:hypothetical protein
MDHVDLIEAWKRQNPDAHEFYLAGPKLFADGRAAWVVPTLFGARIVVSPDLFSMKVIDFWSYTTLGTREESRIKALLAFEAWNGTGAPEGWTRHFGSGQIRDGALDIL